MVPTTKCLHCKAARPIWRRGLCWACYRVPVVRELFPVLSRFGRRGLGLGNRRRPMPTCPTSYRPGTEEKIEVMRQRMVLGQLLHHPLDARVPVVR